MSVRTLTNVAYVAVVENLDADARQRLDLQLEGAAVRARRQLAGGSASVPRDGRALLASVPNQPLALAAQMQQLARTTRPVGGAR